MAGYSWEHPLFFNIYDTNKMKSLTQYISESIKSLSKDMSGIIVFDIDDTLLKANPKVIGV